MVIDLQELGRSIKKLQNRHHRDIDSRLLELGISLSQWDALRAIDRNYDASSHDLAEHTFQTDQSFGALANRLVAKGLVTRSPGKGRMLCHRLTDEGADMLRRATAIVEDVLAQSFAPLGETERAQLLALLLRLVPDPQ
jgi:DNA-binding MarR family transcriptional regulator